MSEEQETELLSNQAEALKRELEAITKRLDELETEG
jgi:prefoldin subunit 5